MMLSVGLWTLLCLLTFTHSQPKQGGGPPRNPNMAGSDEKISPTGTIYYYFKTSVSKEQAEADCHRRGSSLASILNPADMEFFKNIAYDEYSCWLGRIRNTNCGPKCFVWRNGQQVSDFVWGSGEPNNNDGENCMHMRSDGGNDVG